MMINNNWSKPITYRGREYQLNYDLLQPDPNFTLVRLDRIPFLACFTREPVLGFCRQQRQFYRTVSTEILLQVFRDGGHVVNIQTRGHTYFVGKGIILDDKNEVLAMICVTKSFYDRFDSHNTVITEHDIATHFSIVLSDTLTVGTLHRQLYMQLKNTLPTAGIDRMYTSHPRKGSLCGCDLPNFGTIRSRRSYFEDLAAYFANGLIAGVI